MTRRTRSLQLLVVAIAAFASIATSRKKWHIEAQLPADAKGKSRIAFVEASEEPSVTLDNGERLRPLQGELTGMWGGTARYLIPADRTLEHVTIDGVCGGGMFCGGKSECEPADARVMVLSVTPVTTWRKEVVTPTKTEDVQYPASTQFPIVATHPVRLELTATGRQANVHQSGDRIYVNWHTYPEGLVKTTWSLRVIMEDVCPGATACEPPATAKLELGAEARGTW